MVGGLLDCKGASPTFILALEIISCWVKPVKNNKKNTTYVTALNFSYLLLDTTAILNFTHKNLIIKQEFTYIVGNESFTLQLIDYYDMIDKRYPHPVKDISS